MFNFFNSASTVGLEIDRGTIRAVEMAGSVEAPRLINAGQIKLPEDAVVDGIIHNREAVKKALIELWTSQGFKSRNVVYGVFNQGVLLRTNKYPKVPENKLEKMVRFQSEDLFPIPMNEMVLDFAVLSEVEGEKGPELELLLIGARNDMLDKNLWPILEASLKPQVIDVLPLATMKTLKKEQLQGNVVMVNIASGMTTLLLMLNEVPRFARVIPHNLTTLDTRAPKASAEVINLPTEADQAEEAQQDQYSYQEVAVTLDSFEEGQTVAEKYNSLEWSTKLAEQVRSSISFYLFQNNLNSVDRVILTGEGAQLAELPEAFEQELGSQVQIHNPMAQLGKAMGGGVNVIKEGPAFATAIGLALRGLEE
ncbi:type IV pilus assembly protein PilM [Heliorestis acidaminivorans]|uniref:Type IV pilus assembly protein PilM n=1 Tax=Heliorestis acidaminivorans TaxID=553427 RepID=A0A6I0ENK1_9FIRM|nr:type IV pilus assembly protein PilM [Heliorestis acidaminivorans]KAB2951312.1 type IV pilus assembly protein PilM [Heliorestis acidaminivorans]